MTQRRSLVRPSISANNWLITWMYTSSIPAILLNSTMSAEGGSGIRDTIVFNLILDKWRKLRSNGYAPLDTPISTMFHRRGGQIVSISIDEDVLYLLSELMSD
jgi:hypothetical protein